MLWNINFQLGPS